MKFIKKPSLNPKSVTDDSVSTNRDKQVILDTDQYVLVPKGATLGAATEGALRYNTDDGEFEAYQNGAWRELRFKEPANIQIQKFGPGDFVNVDFGPLDSGDPDYPAPTSPNNVLVFVGNVIQIPTENYILATGAGGTFVRFTDEAPPAGEYVTVVHGLDR
jgi:hypothetical protein